MKSRSFIGIAILLSLVFGSCASMIYPEKESPEESLIVIPTEFIQDAGTEHVRSYYLGFSNQKSNKKLSSQRYGKIFVKLTSEEDKIIEVSSRVTNSGYSGDPISKTVDIDLPYAAGKIMISDFKIVQSIVRTKSKTTRTSYDLIELSEEEKNALMEELILNSSLSSWF